ncbi:MAG: Bacitracin transport permease protein BCRC [Candidatus Amesbacteria bacterium GW2011_GWA2_47_11b]|uniref:Bacitracin transport permease protein BCRC n=3 Tax=Candidatus Amesiibacteriota TaxID=1752730 RepID=A0A0G1SKG7_9BACT|nr:MAG: Bacitracin transport permease protein BCRC [Microgenomates group bacterium GW2011_GWC1_46_20]KKU58322.1 MAG: Bacitracin transport permease protein BCRC [Candidatus Amesbacteria bacterium GW2011_GWA2_47_11b]KKU69911.1 MAG: Bacitracin transport permease protein BCRC [Candidatus Amesbacteria bacterium GW2011_GWA1_47_20]KKU84816.1 MAG: Bacitracin transport permease protein BCRC [Candidatus Amesbacteria bacterium GW2011_GWC2_47_8]
MNSIVIFFADYAVFLLFALLPVLWVQKKREMVLHAVISAFVAWLIGRFLKDFFAVPRPFVTNGSTPLAGYFSDGSFPSNHTAAAFAISVSIFLHKHKWGILLIIFSLAIGLSRILGGVHYPLDILGGIAIGSLVAWLAHRLHVHKLLDRLSL